MTPQKKIVLLTGYNGFTGRYLKSDLEHAGHQVIGLDAAPCVDANCYQINLQECNQLTQLVKQIKPDWVVHLAAKAFVGYGVAEDFYTTNLIGTRNLLEALSVLSTPPKKVLIASSANVYGNSTEGIITENTPVNPMNDYAVSKLAMEYAAKLYLNKLPIIITRPFNYTGVGQNINFVVPKIVDHFIHKRPIIELGNINVQREFGDVRFIINIYTRLLETTPVGETINICTGQAHSLQKVIDLCKQITGHVIRVKINPKFIRENEVKILTGDTTRLQALLPNLKFPNLKDTLKWMLSS